MTDSNIKLTGRQLIFVIEYTSCWNATEAARRAGYAFPTVEGSKNLEKPNIKAAISARLAEIAMPATEVLSRLGQHARGSMGEFVKVDDKGQPTGFAFGTDRPQHLIKKIAITDKGITFELYDAQAALALLARHHGLLVDRTELTGKDGGPIETKGYAVREASPEAWDDSTADDTAE